MPAVHIVYKACTFNAFNPLYFSGSCCAHTAPEWVCYYIQYNKKGTERDTDMPSEDKCNRWNSRAIRDRCIDNMFVYVMRQVHCQL